MFGSIMNQAMAKFGGGKAPDRQPTPQRAAADNRPPMLKAAGKSASPSRPVQQGLWALVIITILGGVVFYREHVRIADLEGSSASSAFLAVAPKEASEASEADGSVIKTQDGTEISVIAPAVAASSGELAAAAVASAAVSTEAAGSAAVSSLRSEVASLRQSLQRHEQMLRYIMDRYVEKRGEALALPQDDTAGTAGVPVAEAHGHDAASVSNFSAPEFVSYSFTDEEQHVEKLRGKKQRKEGDVGLGM